MITISALPKAACVIEGSKMSVTVFPEEAQPGQWTLVSQPEEQLRDKIISWPGEYDFQSVTLRAIGQQEGRQVSYVCHIDGLKIGLVNAPVLDWNNTDLQVLGDIDVLVIAAADQKKVLTLVEAADPRIVVLFPTGKDDLAGVCKALGAKDADPVSKLSLKPGSLPAEARQVVVLK